MGGDLDKNADFQEIEFGLISFMRKKHDILKQFPSCARLFPQKKLPLLRNICGYEFIENCDF